MRTVVLSLACVVSLIGVACGNGTIEDGGDGGGGGSTAATTGGGKGATTGGTSKTTTTSGNTSGNASASGNGSGTGDPLDAARQICVDKINALRATKGRAPYARWTEAETCVDDQVTSDEASGQAHGAWIAGTFPACNGSGQNECLGAGIAGIEGCLDQMWAEKDQPGCAGCDACADAYDPSCPNCDFYGDQTGNTCGHYVNMSANYFTMVACGFNDQGSWAAQNFR